MPGTASGNSSINSVSAASVSTVTAPAPDADTAAYITRIGRWSSLNLTPVVPETAFGVDKPAFRHDYPERYTDANIDLGLSLIHI